PTVCNLVEIVTPARRGAGYTVQHLHCPFPDLPPMVGFARTVTIKAKDAFGMGDASYIERRLDYRDYVAAEPRPSVMVIQDLDEEPGYGAFWGEVQSNVHQALGCHGTVTNGSVRDIPMIPPGFQMLAGSIGPSHAYVHMVEYGGEGDVHGLTVRSNEVIHAQRPGAVVGAAAKIAELKTANARLAEREAKSIKAARASDMTVEKLKAAIRG